MRNSLRRYINPRNRDPIPAMSLLFARDKALDPRVTFTRASSGTYFDASGVMQTASTDVARFTHDPVTGQSLGLLIEESRTNLLTYSEEFDNGAWVKSNATISANAITAPDGTITADKFTETTSSAAPLNYTGASFISGTSYTLSVFAKDAGRRYIGVWGGTAFGNGIVFFDMQEGVVTFASGAVGYSITPIGDGWYYLTVTDVSPLSASSNVGFQLSNDGTNAAYTGDGTSGIYIWGAQLEAGSFPTSYIKTTSSTATRAADVPLLTGSNFSSVVDITKGSLFAAYRSIGVGTRPIVSIDDDSTNNQFRVYTSTLDPKFTVVSGGSTVADLDAGTITANADGGIAAAYAVNDYAVSSNGGAAVTDTSGALPVSPTIMRIGHDKAGNYLNGPLASLAVYPARLSNSYLAYLS